MTATGCTGVVTIDRKSKLFSLRMPRTALGSTLADFDACLLRPVPRDNQALRLLTSYIDVLLQSNFIFSRRLRFSIASLRISTIWFP